MMTDHKQNPDNHSDVRNTTASDVISTTSHLLRDGVAIHKEAKGDLGTVHFLRDRNAHVPETSIEDIVIPSIPPERIRQSLRPGTSRG